MMVHYDEKFTIDGVNGERIAKRLSELSSIGATEQNGIDRPGFSSEEKQAKKLMKFWMAEAGLHVREDGAGHDAMIVGRKIPVAMLFVKSKDGVSHNPKEWTNLNDCVQAIHVLKKFIEKQMDK